MSDDVETGIADQWRTDNSGYARSHDSTGVVSSFIGSNSFMFAIRGHVVQPTVG